MRKWVSWNYWFRGVIVVGLLLALLLLVQSFLGYFRISRQIVDDELIKEAERLTVSLERDSRRSNVSDPALLRELLDEILRNEPKKIDGIKVSDADGSLIAQTGKAFGPMLSEEQYRQALDDRVWISGVQQGTAGKVKVAALPFRIRLPRPASEHGNSALSALPAPPRGPRRIEFAVYLDSVASAFGPLRRNLIVSCLAALGLAASMILLWLQFPRYMRGKQLEEQLEIARRVQMDLLPPANPTLENLDFAASCVAAWQVGGDFYDVFAAEDGRTAFVLGDVCGKGIPAALLMGLLHGAVRSLSWLDTTEGHESSSRRLNELLQKRTSPERFASLFWGSYDPVMQTLFYINAGHLPPAVIRRSDTGEFEIHRLSEGGPILGVIPQAGYRQGKFEMQPGDLLVLYSDGIVEAANSSEEEFGEERLWTLVQDFWTRPALEIRDEILEQVRDFLGEARPQDDMTLVVMRMECSAAEVYGPVFAGSPAEAGFPLLRFCNGIVKANLTSI